MDGWTDGIDVMLHAFYYF